MTALPTRSPHPAIQPAGVWSTLLERILLPLGDSIFDQGVMRRLRFLREAQWREVGWIEQERDRRLHELARIASAEVPMYRDYFSSRGLQASDIRGVADLHKLPIVGKDDLRSGYPERTSRASARRTFEVSTSGSTGRNFRVLCDSRTVGAARASFMLALEWAGWRIGDPHMQNGINPGRSPDRRLKDAMLRCSYIPAFDLSDQVLIDSLERLEERRIDFLFGYPSGLYYLARLAARSGWNRPLKAVVTWGDNLYSHYRAAIEQAFGARIHDTYGCSEEIQISAQCSVGRGYHVHALDTIVEYLDDDGTPVGPTERGNLVITRLHPGPMPLIRYRIGDVGVRGAAELCSCGRSFELMESIVGRETDVVLTPSGNRLIVHFFTGILEHYPEVDCFQVVQHERSGIELQIVPAAGYSGDVEDRIVEEILQKGDRELRVDVSTKSEIAASPSGKRRFVVSKVEELHNRAAAATTEAHKP